MVLTGIERHKPFVWSWLPAPSAESESAPEPARVGDSAARDRPYASSITFATSFSIPSAASEIRPASM